MLRQGGRFVEIGKRGVWTKEEVYKERPDVHYELLAMDTICEQEPDRFHELIEGLSERMASGQWDPLPSKVCDGLENCISAMQCLRRAEQIGKVVVTVPSQLLVREGSAFLLTGGTGALGMAMGRALVEEGAQALVLLSRTASAAADSAAALAWLQASSAQIHAWKCDLGKEAEVVTLSSRLRTELGLPVRGALHLAGALDDASLPRLERRHLERVMAGKVQGARTLRKIVDSESSELDFLLAFSSTAALLGAAGQANYAAANACLDALVHHWHLEGLPATSVQWGAWSGIGMAERSSSFARLRQQGIPLELALASMASVLKACTTQRLSVVGCALVRWPEFLRPWGNRGSAGPCYFRDFYAVDASKSEAAADKQGGKSTGAVNAQSNHLPSCLQRHPSILHWVLAVLSGILDNEAVEADEPLMSAGMDSLSAVEFRRLLASEGELALPSTLAFDQPTARAIAEYLEPKMAPPASSHLEPASLPLGAAVEPALFPFPGGPQLHRRAAVLGLAGHLPGPSGDAAEVWEECWAAQLDAVQQVPLLRFDISEVFDADVNHLGFATYAKHASFIEGAELFDPRFFSMSLSEAAAIDPQQRHSLEVAYAACHSAGQSRKLLAKSQTGVFAGQCANDWAKMWKDCQKPGTFMGPGSHASIASNRVSFCLGLEGLSVTVDTACSSTLVALDTALSRISLGLPASIVLGSQLNLISEPFVAFAKGRLLSASGRCKTFNATADGFVRGEGFGALFLAATAGLEFPGEALADIAGSAANQDGRSSSLTAPNGPAQQRAIRAALRDAGVAGGEQSAVECHGTGTALGDPIEVGALRATLQDGRSENLPLMAAKTNVGHLEGAAGAVGLLKCIMVLEQRQVPANLHLAKVNPHIDLEGFDAEVPSVQCRLPGSGLVHSVGLSSFGFGGTNAHTVLRSSCKSGVVEPKFSNDHNNASSGGLLPAETLPELSFRRQPFTWGPQIPRLLRHRHVEAGEVRYEVPLKSDLLELCVGRLVHGHGLVPPAIFLAMALEAGRAQLKQDDVQLRGFQMLAPLLLTAQCDRGEIWLRLVITDRRFELQSRRSHGAEDWAVHCEGRFFSWTGQTARLPSRPGGVTRAEGFEAELGMAQLSPRSLELLSELCVGRREVCARVRLPPGFASDDYAVHPALLEAVQAAVLGLLLEPGLPDQSPALPSFAQDLSSLSNLSAPCKELPPGVESLVLHVKRKGSSAASGGGLLASCTLSVDGGPVVLELQDLQLRPVLARQVAVQAAAAEQRSEVLERPSLFELQWVSASSGGRSWEEEGGRWLFLAPGDSDLVQGLEAELEKCRQVSDDNFDDEDQKQQEQLADSPRSLKSSASSGSSDPSASGTAEPSGEELLGFTKVFLVAVQDDPQQVAEVLTAALRLVSSATKLQAATGGAPEIWFVMQGTQAAQVDDLTREPCAPLHAGLWGLARCARRENPELAVGCMDVGSSSGRRADAAGLLRRLRAASSTCQDSCEEEGLLSAERELLARKAGSWSAAAAVG
ncbi:unnamed protein product [Polarella glacialis]|uniref:Uncharacterized protein n=1 Tax=Polarella glacialis TaxID=89957 RepID=A0A813GXL9_POLGL|nr:unnamed protein product [Polarella glacialis]